MRAKVLAALSVLAVVGAALAAEDAGPKPPEGAILLFDGKDSKDISKWKTAKLNDDGLLLAGALTKDSFGDCLLHVEFNIPPDPTGKRVDGNSGVYVQNRYEIQILNSFGQKPSKGGCGAIYQFKPPDTNQARKPGEWQTYDIIFRQPRWQENQEEKDPKKRFTKVRNARFTVYQNGVKIHDDVETPNKTGAGRPEGPGPGPLLLQSHGTKVAFRNVWLLPLKDGEDPPASALPQPPAEQARP